ncbi:MAG TPA: ABC transporter ATP-binding protein [Gemmatimonadaceae bacterium]|nr:ABC transporter ATP-binding protein [Gemmatimonadaceae bacterium]
MTTVRAAAEFLVEIARGLRWRVALSAIVALAVALTEGTGVLLIVPLLGAIGVTVTDGAAGGFAARVEAAFAVLGLSPTLETVILAFIVVSAAHALLYRAYLVLNPMLEQEFNLALRGRLYGAVMHADWSFLTRQRTSDLIHAATHEVDRASVALYHLLTFFTGLVVSLTYVAIAFRLSPVLTVLTGLAGLGLLWGLRGGTQRSAALGEAHRETTEQQFGLVSESLNGLKVTRSFGAEPRSLDRLQRQAQTRVKAYLDLLRTFGRSRMSLDVASAVLVGVLLVLAVRVFDLRGGGLVLLSVVFSRVMPRLTALQSAAQVVVASLPSFVRVSALIRECEAHSEALPAGKRPLPLRHQVRFENVSYAYAATGAPALDSVTLALPAGCLTAIVGSSGAGKSTLADVLIGLLRPSAGTVYVDGQPLTDDALASWRCRIGYVPQDVFLFHDTVRQNLLWAKPDATDAEMWSALEAAAAAAFVRARPEGLDTVVGDRGLALSGGERQRLALARALLRSPDLLVLDEATSSLDSVNEAIILDAVQHLRGHVTTVIITHRLATIRHADLIHVLDGGRIVESGSWSELVIRNGAFSRLLYAQQSSEPALTGT